MRKPRTSNVSPDGQSRADRERHNKEIYAGNHLGIVIQNNDPERKGRVKIYCPNLTATVYDNWYKIPKNRSFKFIGKNINSDLSDIIEELKTLLPWSECAAPIAGAGATGRYNAHEQTGSISDSSKVETTVKDTTTSFSKYKLNKDGIGEKPARIYECKDLEVHDSFSSGEGTGAPNKVNKFSYQYKPSSYSNQPKGMFSVPNVGAHVWVFFEGCDPMKPVYFASSFGKDDWQQIYDHDESANGSTGPDYPGTYENVSAKDDPSYNHNTETYRNKYVLHANKGGAIEVIGTDNREAIKMSHYSGSFKEFNNETTIEFATNQDQKLVQGDQFLTVKGHKTECTEMDFDQIVRGDYYRKIGTFNVEKYQEWQDTARVLADMKQLFETKRAQYIDGIDNIFIQSISPIQEKSPKDKTGHMACPVCCHPDRPQIWDIRDDGILTRIPAIATVGTRFLGISNISIAPLSLGLPKLFERKSPSGGATDFLGNGDCPCCGGDGISPSTFGGAFDTQDKDTLIRTEMEEVIAQLTEAEKAMGLGGSEIINISKHKVENIGLIMNDFPSIRVDKIGKIVPSEVLVLKEGIVVNQKAVPLIEYVHTDEMPGGSYTLNCANKFNVHAGSNGISFKTYGPVDIGGTIVNVGGEQVNIASENEININAGRVSIVADILEMRQKEYKQVLVNSNLGVAQNMVVGGSLHVEGELSCHHVSAPLELKETDGTTVFGETMPMQIGYCVISYGSSGGAHPVYGMGPAAPHAIMAYDHGHIYEGIPSASLKTHDDVRGIGSNTAAKIATPPMPVENGGFINKLTDKLGDKLDTMIDGIDLPLD